MRIFNWIKGAKAKAMVVLGSFAMLLGVGASVSVALASQQNEVVETKADGAGSLWHNNGGGSGGSWTSVSMTSLGGKVYVLYNFSLKSTTQFNFVVDGVTVKAGCSGGGDYVSTPDSNWGNYGGNNSYYWGSDTTVDFIVNSDSKKVLVLSANGWKSLSFDCSGVTAFTTTYIHFWSTDYSDFGTKWSGAPVSLSNKKFSITLPNCMNKFILNNGSTETATLNLSKLAGDTGSVTCTSNRGGSVTWASNGKNYIMGSMNDWNVGSAPSSSSSGTANVVQWTSVSFTSGAQFKIMVGTGIDGDYFGDDYFYNSSDAAGCFSYTHGGGDNNISCTTSCTCDVFFNTSTKYIYIYKSTNPKTNGYYLCGKGTFSGSAGDYSLPGARVMSTSGVGDNVAIYESASGLAVSKNSWLQIAQISFPQTMWYDMVKGGDWPTGWSIDSNQAKYTGDGGHFNFYLSATTGSYSGGVTQSNGTATLYIVDVELIDTYGFLYFATTAAKGSVTVTSYEDSTAVLNGVALSSVTGVEDSNAINAFNGITGDVHLYKVPIYNFRGADVGKLVNKVVFRVSGSNYTITGLPTSAGATPHYYSNVGAGGSAAATTGMGAAAKAVYDLDAELAGGTSLCDLGTTKWTALKSEIETGRKGSSTLMDAAKITTYASKEKSSTTGVLVSDIYKEICRQLGVESGIAAWPASIKFIPNAPEAGSPLTLTLWIVLGAGIAGMAAIGAAYFVSKKKKRYQA